MRATECSGRSGLSVQCHIKSQEVHGISLGGILKHFKLTVLSKDGRTHGVSKQYSEDNTSSFLLQGDTEYDGTCGKTIYTTGIFLSPDKDTAAALKGVCED